MNKSVTKWLVLALVCKSSYAESWIHHTSEYNIWDRLRDNFRIPDEQIQNNATQNYRKWYEKHPEHLNTVIENAQPYLEYIVSQVEEKDLPGEIALLPFIESNFDPFAYSHAGATGLWQMMPGTASGYGININWWFDGRRDLIESTDKALNYLTYLGDFFNENWLLAISAYDSGEGNVRKAIKKQRNKQEFNFWDLNLPKETKSYIPKLLAIKEIISNPEDHDIILPEVTNDPTFVMFEVNHQVDLNELAKMTGLDIKEIRKYNPGFRRNVTHPDIRSKILIPIKSKNIASSHFNKIKNSKYKKPQWVRYNVKNGDTISQLAVDFESETNAIKAANKLKDYNLKIGQHLMIPTKTIDLKKINKMPQVDLNITQDTIPGPKLKVHVVENGDTISTIAQKYKVTMSEIEFWNKIGPYHKLVPGDEITMWINRIAEKASTYKVKSGDSLIKIAKRHNMTVKKLKNINNLHSDIIKLNQVLRVS